MQSTKCKARDTTRHLNLLLSLLKAGCPLLRLDLLRRQLRAHSVRGGARLRERQFKLLQLLLHGFPGGRLLRALDAQAVPQRCNLLVSFCMCGICARLCCLSGGSLFLQADVAKFEPIMIFSISQL